MTDGKVPMNESGSQILRSLDVTGYGPRIAWFFRAMVQKLDENDHKADWRGSTDVGYFRKRIAQELKELIDKHRDMPGTVLADLVDDLENAVEALVEEVNANGVLTA